MAPASYLRFRDVKRRFGRIKVLTGVSGEVGPGHVLLVSGPNGSGKSTLVRILAGILAQESGTVEYVEDGRSLGIAERRRSLGYVAPDLALYEELSTVENLEFFCHLRGVPRERASEILSVLGLPEDRLAGALSSGMRQRLRWGWALLDRPRLLLLDEPFQNLDRPGVEQGTELLSGHLADGGFAVVANPGPLEVPHVAARIELDL
ncbi:MAG: ATP-binding cassette domain-containing protein [Acidobacteriota bacterium]|jgi:heme exporter protein A